MILTRLSEFRMKEVINVTDGCRLGYVCDLQMEVPEGNICALIVPGPCKWLGLFGRDAEYVIPWHCIKRIGADTVLVDVVCDKVRLPKPKKPFF